MTRVVAVVAVVLASLALCAPASGQYRGSSYSSSGTRSYSTSPSSTYNSFPVYLPLLINDDEDLGVGDKIGGFFILLILGGCVIGIVAFVGWAIWDLWWR